MQAYILSCARTPVGRFLGSLANVHPKDFGGLAVAEALKRAGLGPEMIDEVVLGCVLTAGLGQNLARQAAVAANIGHEVPSYTVNKVCGSGLKAVTLAAQAVAAGSARVVVAGGVESMSRAPHVLRSARRGVRLGSESMVDVILNDGLTCDFSGEHMGLVVERLAEKYGVGREEQDEYALLSHQKAVAAMEEGRFEEEIVPVPINASANGFVEKDEHPRKGLTISTLAKLKPVFKEDGTVTAGNASGINDGAAAIVVASEERAAELGVRPIAKIRGWAQAGVNPDYYGLGPVYASKNALKMAGAEAGDLDLIELNEAFALQSLSVLKETGWDREKINVNGGAVALGHPIGASGARILVTLLHELKRRGLGLGLATLCIGGGQGIAVVVERI